MSLSCIIFSSISLARCPIAGCSRPLKQSSLSLSTTLAYPAALFISLSGLSVAAAIFYQSGEGGNVEACMPQYRPALQLVRFSSSSSMFVCVCR